MNPEACCSSSCCYSSLQRTVLNYSRLSSLAIRILSKQLPSFFCHNDWSFLKSPRPSLPLKRAPPLSPSPISHGEGWLHSAIWKRAFIALICTTFPLRGQGCVNRPTRCSNRFAIWLADHQRSSPAAELRFAVCDRMDTNRLGAVVLTPLTSEHMKLEWITYAALPNS